MIEDTKNTLDSWLEKHGTQFVAHATINYDVVIRSRVVLCAEQVLRQVGKCEHEKYGLRSESSLSHLRTGDNLCEMFSFEKISKKNHKLRQVFIVPKFGEELISSPEGWNQYLNEEKYQKEDCGLFWKFKTSLTTDCESDISGSPFDADCKKLTSEEKKQPYHPLNITISSIVSHTIFRSMSVSDDIANDCQVDKTLRSMYQYFLKKRICPNRFEYLLWGYRNRILGLSGQHIACEVRVAKNSIWWDYGPVAVLIGNPKSKIANQFFGHSFFDAAKSNGREFRLKAPYQVDEGFYQEKIDDRDNLILGPQHILNRYRNDPAIAPSVKERFVELELLTKEQLALFNLDMQSIQNLIKMYP